MSKNRYSVISDFGSNTYSAVNNPLTYAVPGQNFDQKFLHGSSSNIFDGQYSRNSQLYMSQYCADKWDGFCELASNNSNTSFPNQAIPPENELYDDNIQQLTAGDMLIRNTASEKYLKTMNNCKRNYEPFDPTVATSPLIGYWKNEQYSYGGCVPEYAVNPESIDSDIVMNKILAKPQIAPLILVNIYNTMKREGTLSQLQGTRLGNFYSNVPFFKSRGGLQTV